MYGPTARLVALVFDAMKPDELARFWAEALRWEVRETDGGVGLVPTDATSIRLLFRPDRRLDGSQEELRS